MLPVNIPIFRLAKGFKIVVKSQGKNQKNTLIEEGSGILWRKGFGKPIRGI